MKKLFKLWQKAGVGLMLLVLTNASVAFAISTPTPPGGVPVESSLAVANVTAGNTRYQDSVSARVDEVVKFEVWYHNPRPADSGQIARNVNVRISIPAGMRQTHTATSRVAGTNTNIETNIATVSTSINSSLEFIPGSAYRRYNAGTNAAPVWRTIRIPDTVVTSGYTIPNFRPCWNFQETITVQARVRAAVFTVDKFVKREGDITWQREVAVSPGDRLAYMIAIKNVSNVTLTNVLVRDSLPTKLDYVEGSAVLTNGTHPNGMRASDNVINGGTYIGNYTPGAAAYIRFNAIVPRSLPQTGCYTFNNVVNVRAAQTGWVNNNARARACYRASVPPERPPVTPPTTTPPSTLPSSGPAESAALFGLFTLAGTALNYKKSRLNLLNSLKRK